MKKFKITDAIRGRISIAKNKGKYFKTKDSTSPSGHSLVAQIDMTHSGIVTKNYGFYLPARMSAGAKSFTKDYNKPVLIGHDENEDTKPVGRVVSAEYVDTAESYRAQDSYLQKLFQFQDKTGRQRNEMLDFVQHVIKEYDSKDSYRGLGHLRGTVKITDAETIEGILDDTYLTVSTSMVSDSATCSVCGTDWVAEGLCDHSRGQTYEDNVCVVIPGSMEYDHLGIVNTPADPHAHNFSIIGDTPEETISLKLDNKEGLYETRDNYDLAAQLFACKDSHIVSLSSKIDINLIDIKDNIQKMENAMKIKGINDRIKDALDIKIEVYRFSDPSSGEGSKEVSVREYMEELDEKALQLMISQVAGMVESSDSKKVTDEDLKTVVDKYCTENFELVDKATTVTEEAEEDAAHGKSETTKKKSKKKKAKVMSDNLKLEEVEEITDEVMDATFKKVNDAVTEGLIDPSESEVKELTEVYGMIDQKDVITTLAYGNKNDSFKVLLDKMRERKDAQKLVELDSVQIYEMMKELISEDSILSEDSYGELKASDFCGMRGYFPVIDKAHYLAAKTILGKISAPDSVKGRIITAIEKKVKKLDLDLTDSFDSTEDSCNNNDNVSIEDLLKTFEDTKAELEKLGVKTPDLVIQDTDKDQEIGILEAQLDAANEELDSLYSEKKGLKTELSEQLAVRTVDMKMLSGNFEIEDRIKEIEDHKDRSLDSLKDGIKDLETQFKIQDFVVNDGMAKTPIENVEDPTLSQDDVKPGNKDFAKEDKEEAKFKIYDEYNKRVVTYGKPLADRWLFKVQRQNGNIPTID